MISVFRLGDYSVPDYLKRS